MTLTVYLLYRLLLFPLLEVGRLRPEEEKS